MGARQAALILILAVAACQRAPEAAARSPANVGGGKPVNPDPGVRTYRCEDGVRVEAGYPDAETAVVDYGGHAYTLKTQVAASGVRYVGFGLQWWTKGLDEARLSKLKPGETVASDPGVVCRVEAPAPSSPK